MLGLNCVRDSYLYFTRNFKGGLGISSTLILRYDSTHLFYFKRKVQQTSMYFVTCLVRSMIFNIIYATSVDLNLKLREMMIYL
jgi:hypothetical protein